VKAADANISAAQTQLQQIRSGRMPGDVNKAFSDVQAAQNERDKLFSDARDKFYSTIVMPGYKAAVTDPQNAQALATLESQNRRQEAQVTSDVQAGQKVLDSINASSTAARQVSDGVEIAKQLSAQAGQPSFLSNWPETANLLARNNLLTKPEADQLGAQRSLDLVMSRVIGQMRQQEGMSRMTNFDLQYLQNVTPGKLTPEQFRTGMFATLQSAATRQIQYAHAVNSLHASGMPVWQAQEEADKQQPSIVQRTPTTWPAGGPNAGQPMSRDDQGNWITAHVTPGTFYLAPDGSLNVRSENRAQ
jgi:hypothetical protein